MVATAYFTVVEVVDLVVVGVVDFTVVEVVDFTVVEVADLGVVVAVVDDEESRAQVSGPTTPSAVSLFAFWKAITAASVCAPNCPSLLTLNPCAASAAWIDFTPDPLSPRWTLSLGLVTTRRATVVDAALATVEPVVRTVEVVAPDAPGAVEPVAGASVVDEFAAAAVVVVEAVTGTFDAFVVVVAVDLELLLQLAKPATVTRTAAHQISGSRFIARPYIAHRRSLPREPE